MGKEGLVSTVCELSDLSGISSREGVVAEHVKSHFLSTAYRYEKDAIGNVTLFHPAYEPGAKTVLVFAHMDEIGMIVRKVESNGFVRFERLGGVNTQILPGTRVVLLTQEGRLPGVVGVQAHHFMPVENKFSVPPIKDMYIDAFVSSAEEAGRLGIEVGTLVGLEPHCEVVRDAYVTGKSLDNRAAMAVLYGVAERLESVELPYNLVFCFPVMEEYNIRGIMPVIHRLKPDVCIGLDVTPACDTPDLDYNRVALGAGPAVCCMNFHGGGTLAGVLPDEGLFKGVVEAATALGIDLQREVSPGVITENAFALFENDGIRVLNLSIPTRYTHTDNETVAISDMEELGEVLERFLVTNVNACLA